MATGRTPASVLIVDDDAAVTEVLARMLLLQGYRVQTATEPENGLRTAEIAQPNAIILDFHMPRLDGLAFLQALRAHEGARRTPVAIVTGDYCLDDQVSRELRELGATVHFKPLWFDDVVDITQKLLEQ